MHKPAGDAVIASSLKYICGPVTDVLLYQRKHESCTCNVRKLNCCELVVKLVVYQTTKWAFVWLSGESSVCLRPYATESSITVSSYIRPVHVQVFKPELRLRSIILHTFFLCRLPCNLSSFPLTAGLTAEMFCLIAETQLLAVKFHESTSYLKVVQSRK